MNRGHSNGSFSMIQGSPSQLGPIRKRLANVKNLKFSSFAPLGNFPDVGSGIFQLLTAAPASSHVFVHVGTLEYTTKKKLCVDGNMKHKNK